MLSEEVMQELLEISGKQDLAHLVGAGLQKNGLPDKNSATYESFQLWQIKAVYRYEKLNFEYARLCEILEAAEIPFLPLKGSVIRCLYPEPWMRTSCDIDILVHQEDVEQMADYLIRDAGYTLHEKGTHDISLFSSGGQQLELHYRLIEEERAKNATSILQTVWEQSAPKDGYRFWYEMNDEMFYYYHIAHIAKHFEHGGCGLRPFVDLWLLDRIPDADVDKRNQLLQRGGLLRFADVIRRMYALWMDGRELDWTFQQMQEFILNGGVYGTWENSVAMQQQKRGGRLAYVLSQIFIPYDVLKNHYPVLKKHPWLTPVMQVRRWCKLIFRGHTKRVMRVLRYNQSISRGQARDLKQLLEDLGL